MTEEAPRALGHLVAAWIAVAFTMLVLDLLWLGVVATSLYDALGALRASPPYWPAAALFYAFYVAAIMFYTVLPATSVKDAWRRGAHLGFVAYTTYELTNWAVITGWPSEIVLIDIVWGIALTGLVAAAGRRVLQW